MISSFTASRDGLRQPANADLSGWNRYGGEPIQRESPKPAQTEPCCVMTSPSAIRPPMRLQARQFEFIFPRPALVMGILNVTPDSFSDGGLYLNPAAAVEHALEMLAEGAELIDVGGESTRPHAEPVSEAEELRRVIPVIQELSGRLPIPISIDTQKPAVARAALAAGAAIINDIGASRIGDEMARLVAASGCGYVAMHMQGTPLTMQQNPVYADILQDVESFFEARMDHLCRQGVRTEQIVLDVGIGFGKTVEHNLQLLRGLSGFTKRNRPLLLGVSRKSFIGKLLGIDLAGARMPAGLACACHAVRAGAQIIRTHDVGATVQALRMMEAIQNQRE